VRLTVRPTPAFVVSPHFAQVVAAAFGHRRKTLRNALKGVISSAAIDACQLDGGVRPETLAPEAFNILARTLDTCVQS
jgi:16S rRNA (adenine1518-N6/adenine1519-N6)-dimethyltransferase